MVNQRKTTFKESELVGGVLSPDPSLYETCYVTAHKGACRAAAWTKDGSYVATGSVDSRYSSLFQIFLKRILQYKNTRRRTHGRQSQLADGHGKSKRRVGSSRSPCNQNAVRSSRRSHDFSIPSLRAETHFRKQRLHDQNIRLVEEFSKKSAAHNSGG